LCLFEWLSVQSKWLLEARINGAVSAVWSDLLQKHMSFDRSWFFIDLKCLLRSQVFVAGA
jgi:hypothetical protein